MLGQPDEIKRVIFLLGKALNLKGDSLCFCGNGKAFNQCCGSGDADRLIFTKKGLEKVQAYATAHDWAVPTIPLNIWKLFESSASGRLSCLYPECDRNLAGCHLIPENVLRTNYGGHCKDYRLRDGSSISQFVKTGVNRAGCLPVFCSHHDNDLFRAIDELPNEALSKEQCFLFAFKAIAFSLRKTQFLLGIDSQVEIAKPFLMSANPHVPKGAHTIIIDHLSEQYIRFKAISSLWSQAFGAYASKNWDSPVCIHRAFPYSTPLFVAGVVNPSHDLKGQRINRTGFRIAMTCTLYSKDGQLHALLACIDDTSKRLFHKFLKQMRAATDETFVAVVNNLLTSEPMNAFLLPETFELTQTDLQKMESARQRAALALRQAGPIFDLKIASTAVKFI